MCDAHVEISAAVIHRCHLYPTFHSQVRKVDELHDDSEYVAAGFERFRPIRLHLARDPLLRADRDHVVPLTKPIQAQGQSHHYTDFRRSQMNKPSQYHVPTRQNQSLSRFGMPNNLYNHASVPCKYFLSLNMNAGYV